MQAEQFVGLGKLVLMVEPPAANQFQGPGSMTTEKRSRSLVLGGVHLTGPGLGG